jgi:hypothetical protein
MKKIDMVAIGTIAMFACLFFCTPALANYKFDGFPVVTRDSGTVNGGVFIDSEPWDGQTTLTGNFDVPTGKVIWARLYTGIWGGKPEYEGWVNVTFNGVDDSNGLGPLHLQGQNDTNANVWCSGSGKHWIYYDVTDLVNAGAVNTATTTKINATAGNFDGRVYGIVLVVVYKGGDDPKDIQYWINDGSDGLNSDTPHNAGKTDFAGTVDIGNVTEAELTMVHLTAYEPVCANCLLFNGAALDTSMITSNNFELNSWDVAGHVESSGNDAGYIRGIDGYVNVCNAILTLVSEPEELPDMVVTVIDAHHYSIDTPAWFNLLNEIDVTVKNNGTASAGVSNVCLYIDDVFFGKLSLPGLGPGAEHTVTFTSWKPIGADCLQQPCVFDWSYHNYSLKGVADCDGDVAEWNETNNEAAVVERVCYNGYMADEPLENVAQGTLHGHVLFTTGDGSYGGLTSPDDTRATDYAITLPASATVEQAQLNVYYTWVSPDHACPEMEVSITNATGTYVVPLEKAYNDIKCTCPGTMYVKSWGNYVFDIADYVTGSGTYTVTVKNIGSSGHSFYLAAPGIVLVYADESAPLIEYWVNTGADLILGGRDSDGGYLSLEECINNATFAASTTTGEVATATLGVVAPWGDNTPDDVLYFNGAELGRGVYNGYTDPYSEEIDSITVSVGGSNAQVGVEVTDVTAQYLKGSANVVGQGDNGDCMMPANAFLVVAYEEEVPPEADLEISALWKYVENCTICYKVTNIGSGTAPACHNTALYVDDVEVAYDHVPVDLASGESYIGCFGGYEWMYTPPSDFITVCADNNETLVELDENNNCLSNIWECGDVNGDGKVTMSDVRKVFNRYLDPNYPLDLTWAADVNCDGKVTMSDVRKVFNRYLDPSYGLNCCCDGVG